MLMIEKDLLRCKICGDTVPSGKELCWCCEHGDKLHKTDLKTCNEDACKIEYQTKKGA